MARWNDLPIPAIEGAASTFRVRLPMRAERVKEVYLSIYLQVALSTGQPESAPSSECTSTCLLDYLNPYLQIDILSCLHDFKCSFSPTARCQLAAMGTPSRATAEAVSLRLLPCPGMGRTGRADNPFQETISVPQRPGIRSPTQTLNGQRETDPVSISGSVEKADT